MVGGCGALAGAGQAFSCSSSGEEAGLQVWPCANYAAYCVGWCCQCVAVKQSMQNKDAPVGVMQSWLPPWDGTDGLGRAAGVDCPGGWGNVLNKVHVRCKVW